MRNPGGYRLLAGALLIGACACSQREVEPGGTYYERKIAPLLEGSCARSPTGSGCHVAADDRGNALGNLDVTSYDRLVKRRDLLADYGPYGMPALLAKAVPPQTLLLTAWDGTSETVTTDIPHAGGSLLDPASAGFATLTKWLERGATENNSVAAENQLDRLPCVDRVGSDPLFDPTTDPATPDWDLFVNQVNDFLVENCAGANCHGAAQGSLGLSCGKTPEQKRWNYFSASEYVSSDPEQSELLRRALSPAWGGTWHEGGAFFDSPDDPDYQAILQWITQKGGPSNVPTDAGFEMFARRVQPMLVKKGCVLLGCHSTPAFNDFRPRAGSGGSFGLATTRNNYNQLLKQVALESPDPNASRALRKNLRPGPAGLGIRHRGGALFAGAGDPAACDLVAAETGPLDEQDPYCVLVAWLAKERAERAAAAAPLSGIVYVRRPPAPGRDAPQDWADYAPGADLRHAGATLDAQGQVVLDGSDQSLLGGCGLDPASADVRRPAVSWDGSLVAFAARTAADQPLRIYTVKPDGSGCALEPTIDAAPTDDQGNPLPTNGELVHNFDPGFAPDGTLVFVSTRGNVTNVSAFEYRGPQRTPADPSKLDTNLYVVEGTKIRQLTFLLNQELQPSFKLNGQLLFTTEKRAPGLYQLAARRINLDGGDYHPLFGQRGTVGFDQVTDIIQLPDHNFAGIFSQRGAAHGAGTLAIINRSLGPDQLSALEDDYTVDPGAIAWPNPDFFQRSVTIVDPGATGRVDTGTTGAYRNPAPLPNGKILVSWAANVVDLSSFSGNFDVVVIDPVSGARTPLPGLSDPSQDEIWAVPVWGHASNKVFRSSPQTPNGSAVIYTADDGQPRTDRADLTFLDFPLITSLMFQNTRTGRIFSDMPQFAVWQSLPPETEKSLDDESPFITEDRFGRLYVRRRRLGTVPLLDDHSARVQIPGGVPVVFEVLAQLAGDTSPTWHHQREETQYYPGEWVTLSFRRDLYNGFCGGCHGAISGFDTDIAVSPDVLTQASLAQSKSAEPTVLVGPNGAGPQGPPFP